MYLLWHIENNALLCESYEHFFHLKTGVNFMNIPQVIITDTVSFYLLLTLLLEAKFKDILGEREGFLLRHLIYATMLSSILDMILTLIDGKQGPFLYYLNYYGNAVLFITPVLIAWL